VPLEICVRRERQRVNDAIKFLKGLELSWWRNELAATLSGFKLPRVCIGDVPVVVERRHNTATLPTAVGTTNLPVKP